MAISSKGKRKVNIKGRQYLWYVEDVGGEIVPEEGFKQTEARGRELFIISTDRRFVVRYRLPQPGDPSATLHVDGSHFPRQPGARQVQVPRWRHDSKRYPTADFVRRLIGWCLGLEDNPGEANG